MRAGCLAIGGTLGAAILLVAVLVVRAERLDRARAPVEPLPPVTARAVVDPEILATAIRLRTISTGESAGVDSAQFLALHRHLETSFPRVHAALRREVVNGLSLLYTWPGSDTALAPALLLAHMDVVPVEPGTESRWTHPPFSGAIADGFVWGRGTLDDKVGVVGILQAAELLLAEGFQPRRTLHFAFGHDEELGGSQGAARIAALIAGRTPSVELIVDEGSVIAEGLIDGVDRPIALVGIAEKSSLSVELSVESEGGHSSMPPPHSAVGTLARAVRRLEDRQMPARLGAVAHRTFDRIAPEMSFGRRVVFANVWLFRPLIERLLAATPSGNAMLRTTTAATMFTGGPKENVLPARATAVVNFRVLPGDSIADVPQRVIALVDEAAAAAGSPSSPSGQRPHP